MQACSGEVEINLCGFFLQMHGDPQIWSFRINIGPPSDKIAEAVHDGILDAQGGKVRVGNWSMESRAMDGESLVHREMLLPREGFQG